jgi:hypothetical protein
MEKDDVKFIRYILKNNKCPHCNKDLVMSVLSASSKIEWIMRPEDLHNIKNGLTQNMDSMNIDEDTKEELQKLLNNLEEEETLVVAEDVGDIEKEDE